MTFQEWYASLTPDDEYVFNLDGAGFPRDRAVMMEMAWNAAIRHGRREGRELAAQICDVQRDLQLAHGNKAVALGADFCSKNIRAELEGKK